MWQPWGSHTGVTQEAVSIALREPKKSGYFSLLQVNKPAESFQGFLTLHDAKSFPGFPPHLNKAPTQHSCPYLLLCLISHILSLSCSATLVSFLLLKHINFTSASGRWHLCFLCLGFSSTWPHSWLLLFIQVSTQILYLQRCLLWPL